MMIFYFINNLFYLFKLSIINNNLNNSIYQIIVSIIKNFLLIINKFLFLSNKNKYRKKIK